MRDLQELFDAVDLVVGAAVGVAPEASVEAAARAMRHLRGRRGYHGATLVVALGGGTGSGKSSLLNAIAGEPIATVGRIRPTTDRPMAWVPSSAGDALDRLLDDLGIDDRHVHDRDPGVAMIDLPDMDSIAVSHRHLVERMTGEVDALLWVLDPDKYHDHTLHEDFLAPLAAHAEQDVFVLNKIDRIDAAARGTVLADVEDVLVADGYADPGVFPVAVDPGDGPPVGVEALVQFLETELDHKRAAHGKLVADVAAVVRTLAVESDVWEGAAAGLDELWAPTRDALVVALDPEAGIPDEDARCRLEDLVATFASRQPAVGPALRSRLGHDRVEETVTAAREARSASGEPAAAAVLDAAIAAPVAELVEPRARLAALAAFAHVGARQLADRDGVMSW
jgi:energy-coupling factor transporter ATP-binding protein EcfA2